MKSHSGADLYISYSSMMAPVPGWEYMSMWEQKELQLNVEDRQADIHWKAYIV